MSKNTLKAAALIIPVSIGKKDGWLSSAVLALGLCFLCQYAVPESNTASSGLLDLEEVIVTATTRPKQKINSTNAITTYNEEKLERLAPSSLGELVRGIPGFHAEDTAGETGNNIAPRGFPLTTQTEFTALQRDGLTVFYNQDILFTQSDRFTRLSSFINNIEAVRGGASSVFIGSAPAGYLNLISREGGPTTQGDMSLEFNNHNRFGLEAWVSGTLSDQTTYAIGGWYREDDSPRDSGFIANQGGELNANLKHKFKNSKGFTKFEYNTQDDKTIFFVPHPLTGSTKNAKTIAGGPSIRDGTNGHSGSARLLKLANTPSGTINIDVADGSHTDATYIGNITEYRLDNDWILKNHVRHTQLKAPFNGIINVGNAESLSQKAQTIFYANNVILNSAADLNGNPLYQIRDAGTGFILADQSNVSSFNVNGMGISAGVWQRNFDADNFQNDLQLSRTIDKVFNGSLHTTFALFFSHIEGDLSDFRINTLQSVESLPQRLDIVFVDSSGSEVAKGTYRGIQTGAHGFANISYSERTLAPYLDLEYLTGNLTLNLGLRWERLKAEGEAENSTDVTIASFAPDADALNGAIELPFGNSTFRNFDLNYNEIAWTLASNYQVTDNLAFFGRYTEGFRMPDVDKYMNITAMATNEEIVAFNRSTRPETEPTSTVMAEAGVKYLADRYAGFVTLYFASADDLFFNVPTVVGGQVVQRQAFRNTETYGMEAELSAQIIAGWHLGLSYTYQKPEFVDTPIAQAIVNGQVVNTDINGNLPVRVPETFGQFTTSYIFENLGLASASVNLSYNFSGKRYADDANTAELPAYGVLNIGASIETEQGFYIRTEVKNINNSEGLTEGDPRAGETVAGQTPTFNARIVLPRTVTLQIGTRF